jgi:hypothetical protein
VVIAVIYAALRREMQKGNCALASPTLLLRTGAAVRKAGNESIHSMADLKEKKVW